MSGNLNKLTIKILASQKKINIQFNSSFYWFTFQSNFINSIEIKITNYAIGPGEFIDSLYNKYFFIQIENRKKSQWWRHQVTDSHWVVLWVTVLVTFLSPWARCPPLQPWNLIILSYPYSNMLTNPKNEAAPSGVLFGPCNQFRMSHHRGESFVISTCTAAASAAEKKKNVHKAQNPNSIINHGITWNFSMAWMRYMTRRTRLTQNAVMATKTNHSPTACSL